MSVQLQLFADLLGEESIEILSLLEPKPSSTSSVKPKKPRRFRRPRVPVPGSQADLFDQLDHLFVTDKFFDAVDSVRLLRFKATLLIDRDVLTRYIIPDYAARTYGDMRVERMHVLLKSLRAKMIFMPMDAERKGFDIPIRFQLNSRASYYETVALRAICTPVQAGDPIIRIVCDNSVADRQ